MTTFETYIRKQKERDGYLGDFARDLLFVLKDPIKYAQYRGTETITSDTLWGHYLFLAPSTGHSDRIIEALCGLWREWLEYKHVGLKCDRPKRGYVYFFRMIQKEDMFKIGRTKTNPGKRLAEVALREKANIEIYDWMKVDHYGIIEKELHKAFYGSQLLRESFIMSQDMIDEAILLYSKTDCDPKVLSVLRDEDDATDYPVNEGGMKCQSRSKD